MSHKHIMHMDLDTFYVSVERKLDSRLQNKTLLVGGTSDRGVVAACSYETRGYGVHSGMSMKLARQLCPEAIVIRGNAGTYSKHSDEVTEIVKEQTPLFPKYLYIVAPTIAPAKSFRTDAQRPCLPQIQGSADEALSLQ